MAHKTHDIVAKVGEYTDRQVWQPIETAPKDSEHKYSAAGPIVALASDYGHRAIGYWGKGIDGAEGWINPHDHLRMSYGDSFSWWMPIPDLPEATP